MASAGNTRILARAEHQSTALVWRVACDACLQVLASSRQHAKEEPHLAPKGIVGNDSKRGVMGMLCQAQQGFAELSCRLELWPCIIIPPQTIQDRDQFGRLAHLLAQRPCLGVGVLYLGRCVPFGDLQGRAEQVQGQGVLHARVSLGRSSAPRSPW